MNISAGLVAKGIGGALATAAAIGGSIAVKNNGWFGSVMNLTKFDRELIKWLETNGNDIVFTIKYKPKDESEKELKTSDSIDFISSFVNDSNDPVKISVKVDGANTNLKGNGSKDTQKALNDNKNWIWVCEMTFKKDEGSSSVISINGEHNKRVYGFNSSDEDGLFKKLMKDVTSENSDVSTKIKRIKKDFIEKCAKERTEENQTIEGRNASDDREIKASKTKIEFVLAKSGGKSELYFNDTTKFDKWFPEEVNS